MGRTASSCSRIGRRSQHSSRFGGMRVGAMQSTVPYALLPSSTGGIIRNLNVRHCLALGSKDYT